MAREVGRCSGAAALAQVGRRGADEPAVGRDPARHQPRVGRFAEIGAEPVGNTPDEMRAQIAAETARFAKLVKDAKVAIE